MSGGISAIKGFDYQATVILDRLFDHFDRHGSTAFVRPEGEDDLDLFWTDNSMEYRQYIQIKKPTETIDGVLNPTLWTLTNAINDLFPNAISHLTNHNYEQIWILGDEVSKDLKELVNAGKRAALEQSLSYLTVIHKISKDYCLKTKIKLSKKNKVKIQRWKIPKNIDPNLSIEQKLECFFVFAKTLKVAKPFLQQYVKKIIEINALLPDILSRIKILSSYGTETEVVNRIYQRLENNYQLSRTVIENTLFRNLRGFINDISKQPQKTFNKEDFEFELRTVWPAMVAIKEPPIRGIQFIHRNDLVTQITQDFTGKAIEITGVSGSGKTSLASETLEYIRSNQLDRTALYVEVTDDISLRDVLTGVAFHLRRQDIIIPFSVAIDHLSATERVLQELAQCLSSCGLRIMLLIDLVHGNCTDSFAKDLNHFISSISGSPLQIAIFSQEMPLREMNSSTKAQHKISHLNIPGFKFEEFVQLVTYGHKDADESKLWWIYQRITVGRETGLLASLAQTLAHVETIHDMRIIAEMPADEMLAEAERKRFSRVTPSLLTAAKKLTCFALPFSKAEALTIFPTEDIREAIHELIVLGLLRKTGDNLFEMHEIVRAGLESFISLDIHRRTHEQLAEWYAKTGNISAQIFHLEKAGKPIEAHAVAKDVFMKGKDISSLDAYILKNNIINQNDLLNVLSNPEIKITDHYIFPFIARHIGNTNFVEQLFELINAQSGRFQQDFYWSTSVMRIILELDKTKLYNLIAFAIKTQKAGNPENSSLDWFTIAAHRVNLSIGPDILTLFENQHTEIQWKLIPILLLDWRREILKPTFNFINSHPVMMRNNFRSNAKIDIYQKLNNFEKVNEFLAALPSVEIDKILVTKSVCLGAFEDFIWKNKDDLNKQAIAIIKQNEVDEIIVNNALRILLFLAEPNLPELCNSLLTRTDSTAAFVSLLPSLLPSLSNKYSYENDFFDENLSLDKRITALSILLAHGADIGELYRRTQETEPFTSIAGWNFWFLMQSMKYPFPEAIPLLEARLASENDVTLDAILLVKLGELPVPEALTLLINSLNHADVRIRHHAALTLARKRSNKALPYLVKQLELESDEKTAVSMLTASIASGSPHTSDLSLIKFTSSTIDLWKCILAMRTRDLSFSERIISLASDKNLPWQTRRAAILAAGRIPFDLALNRIISNILEERSSLTIDQNFSLLCHLTISSHLLHSGADIIETFVRGKNFFINVWGMIFEKEWEQCISRYDLPTGDIAAGWLFDRLAFGKLPQHIEILDQIINELHIPILHAAILRSLRLCGRNDLIEKCLAQAPHVWFAIRCLKELHLIRKPNIYSLDQILEILSSTHWHSHPIVKNVVENFFKNPENKTIKLNTNLIEEISPTPQSSVIYLSYNDILDGLEQPDLILDKDFAFSLLTQEEMEKLIIVLNTPHERSPMIESVKPRLNFTSDGYTVAQRISTSSVKSSAIQLRTLLRPALAAANRYDLNIPWHQAGLRGTFYDEYINNYIKFLGLQNAPDLFYHALTLQKDILIPSICEYSNSRRILKYIDSRIIPFIEPLTLSGNDDLFEGLCMLAAEVTTDSIDLVLKKLFSRFILFFKKASQVDINYNIPIWRGFKYITNHPRFDSISNLTQELTTMLQADLTYFHKQDILRILERYPSSYITIESQLLNAANFEHFSTDEIDRLDDAAEKLFHKLL